VFGRVEVERLAYQAPGTTDLHPMDAALNLPREMFSHGIRRMVAKEAARASFDEVVEIVRDYTGSSIAKRRVEELAVRAAQDFDAFYEQRAAARDPKDDLLVISTDGKGVVMRHEDLRVADPPAAPGDDESPARCRAEVTRSRHCDHRGPRRPPTHSSDRRRAQRSDHRTGRSFPFLRAVALTRWRSSASWRR